MKITGGYLRSRKLKVPSKGVRPTLNRVRETIFNILCHQPLFLNDQGIPLLHQARVLDAFAGTGSLGIEALSRGAQEAIFFETSSHCIEILRENIRACQLVDRVKIFHENVLHFSKNLDKLDFVFLDPPYQVISCHDVIEYFYHRDFLHEKTVIVCETDRHIPFEKIGAIQVLYEKMMGPCRLSFCSFPNGIS